uniref:TCDD inducible poly(ADP-ribose) polymerase n=1 Tax=Leptobrachium leishanense TaxID=445787 RepID=A0A8C5PFB9_9ANUR
MVFIMDTERSQQMTADTKPQNACSDVHDRFLQHSDKIPPVKPCFKKKPSPKVLNPGTFHTLRPLFNSFLETGTLNGIFVPRNQTGNPGSLCEPLMKKALEMEQQCPQTDSLMSTNPSLAPMMDHPPSVPSTQNDLTEESTDVIDTEPTFPSESSSAIAANTANDAFQDPLLHARPSDNSNPNSLDKASEKYAAGFIQDVGCLDQYNLNKGHANTGIFNDKTEEASLLLVFELLNQLQYHVHQKDGVDICMDFLQGLCCYGNDCPKHHTVLPYHWQVRSRDGFWLSLNDDSQEHMERLYCSPDRDRIKIRHQGLELIADLNCMCVYESQVFDQIRRLSTPSTSGAASVYHTVWKYFCHDNFGWREYSEPVVKLIEEANVRGLKEVRFVTFHNQYVLNIKDGFQQHACFRKEIKRRPLFRSSVMLMPHLQTLSGLAPINLQTNDSDPSHLLSPVAITFPNFYPETWIPMDSTQEFTQVPMSREDKSYRTVYTLFHKTISETKFRILKIQRVQNLFLWEKYKRKKEFMARKMTGLDKIMNERHLFHGTTQDVVDGICKHNFDPRVCGKHATLFGQGSYFARKASYSHGFSKRSTKGVHYMFLAKVLSGRYTVGNHTMRRPPPLNPLSITSDLYDSCVDNFFEPQIFVIFNDDQSYPYFIIQYEEVSDTVSI